MDTVFREYIYADYLQHSTHTLVDSEGLIENGHHQVCADGYPDLGLHSPARGTQAVEGFDAKVLLDPLEEEFDLPAGFVDFRDHNGVDLEVVGYEDQAFPGFCIQKAYSAQVAPIEAWLPFVSLPAFPTSIDIVDTVEPTSQPTPEPKSEQLNFLSTTTMRGR